LFLADENIPLKIIQYLRKLGYKVFDLREQKIKFLTDDQVLQLAKDKNLVLITFDKHFANITKYPPQNYNGIIRIRIHPPVFEDIRNSLKLFLNKISINEMYGKLIILEKKGYRIRK